jgi:predicted nucleic acid-binding protein
VIALDTKILVYAHREDSPFHEAALRCVAELAAGSTPLTGALDQVDAWLEWSSLTLLTESAAHWPTLRVLLVGGHIVGAQVHDARVAALCRQHGVRELWSADRDFSRFAGLAVVNPLAGNG